MRALSMPPSPIRASPPEARSPPTAPVAPPRCAGRVAGSLRRSPASPRSSTRSSLPDGEEVRSRSASTTKATATLANTKGASGDDAPPERAAHRADGGRRRACVPGRSVSRADMTPGTARAMRIRCGTYGSTAGQGRASATSPAARGPRQNPAVTARAARRVCSAADSSTSHAEPAPKTTPETTPATSRPSASAGLQTAPTMRTPVATQGEEEERHHDRPAPAHVRGGPAHEETRDEADRVTAPERTEDRRAEAEELPVHRSSGVNWFAPQATANSASVSRRSSASSVQVETANGRPARRRR